MESSMTFLKITLLLASFSYQIPWIKCYQEDCTIRITSELTPQTLTPNQEDECEMLIYEITASKESSIIYITSSSYLNNGISTYLNVSNSPTSATYYSHNGNDSLTTQTYDADTTQHNPGTEKISVQFEELSYLSSGDNHTVVMDAWYFTSRNVSVHRQYLSRTTLLRVLVKVTGNWSGNGIRFSYMEVEFNVLKSKTSKELGEISLSNFEDNFHDSYHRPNSAYVFQILKTRNINASSISLTLQFAINEGVGEYLLIGSGAVPFHGPPPMFIANDENEKKFQVNDENAYIVYVATSSLHQKSSHVLSIRWKHRGTKITVDELVNPIKDDILQSIQVCIYNVTAGLEELKKSQTEQFKPFKEELARKSNELLGSMTDSLSNISSSRISFYRLSAIDKSEKIHRDGILYVMLKVEGSSKGKAAFDREFLLKVFRSFGSFQSEDGYEIGECPKRKPVESGFYAMIPIFCTVILLAWIGNQNSFLQYFVRMEDAGLSIENIEQNMGQETEENHYSQPDPSLQHTRAEGRRPTLTMNFNNTLSIFTQNASTGSPTNEREMTEFNSRVSEIRSRYRRSGYYNRGFEDDEGNTSTLPKPVFDEGARCETENVYDSLRSSKSTDKIYDTKL